MRGVSDERRRRLFTRTDAGYRINKNVRVCSLRPPQMTGPSFSRLDLVSCRNILILEPGLQNRVLVSD